MFYHMLISFVLIHTNNISTESNIQINLYKKNMRKKKDEINIQLIKYKQFDYINDIKCKYIYECYHIIL